MKSRKSRSGALAFLITILALLEPVPQIAAADSLPAQWSGDDKRLQKRVSFVASKVYVADLVEKLGAQADVVVTADQRTAASDEIIMVSVRDVPLAKVLDSLW